MDEQRPTQKGKELIKPLGWLLGLAALLLVTVILPGFSFNTGVTKNVFFDILKLLGLFVVGYFIFEQSREARGEGKFKDFVKISAVLIAISIVIFWLRPTKGCDTSNYSEDDQGMSHGYIVCPPGAEQRETSAASQRAVTFFVGSTVIALVGFSKGKNTVVKPNS